MLVEPTLATNAPVETSFGPVTVTVGDLEVVSAITRTSAEQLGLRPGDAVRAVIKSTEVLIDKP